MSVKLLQTHFSFTLFRIKMFRDSRLAQSDPSSEKKIRPPINAKCMVDKAVQVSPDHMGAVATSTGIIYDTLVVWN
jgi:hypothetical protein